ncbi:biofilm formation regulator BssR [Siccibacter turicensis]|uniref:biofilm formation regulator BssR n=1 Tax=Siccibacter turicensis TaxID=357233 RepID=UPI000463DBD4|nr:biofilm formation regulator BssR [Siccibacter turicensis]MDY0970278.1 biofilm formation regulator BssR [Siccibacter turicensis]
MNGNMSVVQWLLRAEDADRALNAYLQLRQAKGYMSTRDNDALRRQLSDLYQDSRRIRPADKASLKACQGMALMDAIEAFSSAAVCLMTGRHDTPAWIAVDAIKLERAVNTIHPALGLLAELRDPHHA